MSRLYRSTVASVLLMFALACADSPTQMPDLSVVAVEVFPADRTISVGDSMLVTANARTADGQIRGDVLIAWASGDESVATVRPDGLRGVARALKPGIVEISAATEGKTGKVNLTVIAAPLVVSSVQITPSVGALEVGKQAELRALLRAQDGTVIGGRTVSWQTSDPTIATIYGAADGAYVTLSTHRVGVVVVTATVEGKSAQRTITVTQVSPVAYVQVEPDTLLVETGKDFELRAALYGANGQPVTWSSVLWYSNDASIAEVKSVAGQRAVITAHKAGTARITADVNGHMEYATIRVKNPVNVQGVAIPGGTFAGHTLWAGQIASYRAVVFGPGGVETPDHPVSWSVQNPASADMRADGVLHALAPGTTYLEAEAGGKKTTSRLTVYPVPTNGIELELRPSEDPLGYPRVAIVVGYTTWTDADGTTYAADKVVVAGTLNIGKGISGYEHRLEIETVLLGVTQRRVVARETIIDRGTVMYNVLDPLTDIWLTSTVTPGPQIHTVFHQPGRLVVTQTIGSTPSVDYLYVVK